jgi:pyridoxamine 5'-phosphate oxidase
MPHRHLSPPPPFYDDLAESFAYAWALLESGARDRLTGFHALSVSSVELTAAGPVPRSRTMILRDANQQTRTLQFNTDQRSPKFSQISRTPTLCITHYDASQKIELRMLATGTFHLGSEIAERAWNKMHGMSRFCYRSPRVPGEPVASPSEYLQPDSNLVQINDPVARGNFCVLVAKVHELEWIYLDSRGNRRARMTWVDDVTPPTSSWIQH